jgi:hypothetical protein
MLAEPGRTPQPRSQQGLALPLAIAAATLLLVASSATLLRIDAQLQDQRSRQDSNQAGTQDEDMLISAAHAYGEVLRVRFNYRGLRSKPFNEWSSCPPTTCRVGPDKLIQDANAILPPDWRGQVRLSDWVPTSPPGSSSHGIMTLTGSKGSKRFIIYLGNESLPKVTKIY